MITRGLYDTYHPNWGVWSGRYTEKKQKYILSRHKDIATVDETHTLFYVFTDVQESWTDPVSGNTYNSHFSSIFRSRRQIIKDFAARMDWTIKPYKEANHPPVAKLQTPKYIEVKAGEKVNLSVEGSSNPDGDNLSYKWIHYGEPGNLLFL